MLETSQELCDLHIPVTAIGVGDFNEEVLMTVADRTQGRVLDVVSDQSDPEPPAIPANQLPKAILGELEEATKEVVTDITLSVKAVKGVDVKRVTRVAPQQVEVALESKPFVLGNAAHGGRIQHSSSNVPCLNDLPTECVWLNWV